MWKLLEQDELEKVGIHYLINLLKCLQLFVKCHLIYIILFILINGLGSSQSNSNSTSYQYESELKMDLNGELQNSIRPAGQELKTSSGEFLSGTSVSDFSMFWKSTWDDGTYVSHDQNAAYVVNNPIKEDDAYWAEGKPGGTVSWHRELFYITYDDSYFYFYIYGLSYTSIEYVNSYRI